VNLLEDGWLLSGEPPGELLDVSDVTFAPIDQ
jgi:hypothetical protein